MRERLARPLSWLTTLALAAGVVGLFVAVQAVRSGEWHATPVLSGSMEPGIATGGVVITQRRDLDDLALRDVIVLHRPDDPDRLVVHRVVSLERSPDGPVIRTQGDANDVPDDWRVTLKDEVHVVRADLPYVGRMALALRGDGARTGLTAAGVVLLVLAAAVLLRRDPQLEDEVTPPAQGEPVAEPVLPVVPLVLAGAVRLPAASRPAQDAFDQIVASLDDLR